MKNLEVVNGEMSFSFDPLVDTYTVWVDEDTNELVFEYTLEDDASVNIINNKLDAGVNFVYMEITSEKGIDTITFMVYKEDSTEEVMHTILDAKSVEVVNEYPWYSQYLIIGGCTLVILIAFLLLFCRRKKRRR